MPRYISVPDPIVIINPITGREAEPRREVSFREFIIESVMGDPRWVRTLSDVEAGQEIMEALKSEKKIFSLEKATWDKLKAVVDQPQNGYQGFHGAVLPQLLPFLKAVVSATEKDPTEAKG